MKKIITAVTLTVTICFLAVATVIADTDKIHVIIDGAAVNFDVAPQIIDGRTMVPVRGIFEAVGAEIYWDGSTGIITSVTADGSIIKMEVGSTGIYVNNTAFTMDTAPMIVGGRTLVPARFVAVATGKSVEWDQRSRSVIIKSVPQAVQAPADTAPEAEVPLFTGIPNRRLTYAEIDLWIRTFNIRGGSSGFELEVVRLINRERAAAGLPALTVNPELMKSARFKVQSMYYLDYFDHNNPIYGGFSIIPRYVFGYVSRRMGENLAWGQRTPEAVVREWMASPGHRANILRSDFTETGVGFYNNRWSQLFGES